MGFTPLQLSVCSTNATGNETAVMISAVMRDQSNFIIRGTTGETALRFQMKGNILLVIIESDDCTLSRSI